MAEKTDLNVAPYYDDFDSSQNYVKTLFRPGFAIQARELTQLQTALQNQISVHGQHIFKEGAMVIPGQVSFIKNEIPITIKAQTPNRELVNDMPYISLRIPIKNGKVAEPISPMVYKYA